MKMFFATLGTETNTFSPMPTGWNVWKDFPLIHRDEPVQGPMDPTALLGPLAEQRNWELSRGLLAYAMPAGVTPKPVYESLRDELIADLEAAMPVDGVSLLLHGAMVAGDYDDCEGDSLAATRQVVGAEIPVGAVLDLHVNLTDQMLKEATVLVGYKEYPHTDIFQRLEDLFHIVADTAEGKVHPVMSSFEAPMVGFYHTTREPMGRCAAIKVHLDKKLMALCRKSIIKRCQPIKEGRS